MPWYSAEAVEVCYVGAINQINSWHFLLKLWNDLGSTTITFQSLVMTLWVQTEYNFWIRSCMMIFNWFWLKTFLWPSQTMMVCKQDCSVFPRNSSHERFARHTTFSISFQRNALRYRCSSRLTPSIGPHFTSRVINNIISGALFSHQEID